jgi:hypothetical protein
LKTLFTIVKSSGGSFQKGKDAVADKALKLVFFSKELLEGSKYQCI